MELVNFVQLHGNESSEYCKKVQLPVIKVFRVDDNFNQKNKDEDFDMAAEDLRLATRHLGMIVGKVDVEEILGSIFNDFCIGK